MAGKPLRDARVWRGSLIGVASAVALGLVMLPVRSDLSAATPALVLVIPVLAGAIAGGFPAGLASVAAGFLIYDWAFVPPYGTVAVAADQGWLALAVYATVMVVVARIVTLMDRARSAAAARESSTRRLVALTELLLAERPVADLGRAVLEPVCQQLGVPGAALLLAGTDGLEVAAAAGRPIDPAVLHRISVGAGAPVHLAVAGDRDGLRVLALSTPARPIGVLVLAGGPTAPAVSDILPAVANHLALALERAELHERALRAEVIEEGDRVRAALLGAVSHDLRTPLATIKVASSALRSTALGADDVAELVRLVDTETDRLSGLVGGLLDLTRLQAGVLGVHLDDVAVADLVAGAAASARPPAPPIERVVPAGLPAVRADRVLIGQVLANLVDNAVRFAPEDTAVVVAAAPVAGAVEISVTDAGPGVPAGEREAIFDSFVRFDTGGRSGLGLWIAKSFVEAHGQRIRVDDHPGGGTRFSFTLAASSSSAAGVPAVRVGSG